MTRAPCSGGPSAVVAYPLVWVAFTLIRGFLTGWFPYPFLQPGGPGGWASVFGHIAGVAVFVIAIASVAIGVSRVVRLQNLR